MDPRRPLLYEVNTRCWLADLSAVLGGRVQLGSVPDREIESWAALGVTQVWLMGVWSTGPRARKIALADPRHFAFEGITEADVAGSPYAIAEYSVDRKLGGDRGLARFRGQLHRFGLKLLLDFVGNHLGLDHPWVRARRSLFVQGPRGGAGTFPVRTREGVRWLAHGQDPYFPPWIDTAQLDYRLAETQAAMIDVLRRIAGQCDGARCDMTMLLLSDVFERNWKDFPARQPLASGEFWPRAMAAVRADSPEFIFLAEAYWNLEERLQSCGFDYTYDKLVADLLFAGRIADLQCHLQTRPLSFHARNVHFLENHDEPRVAARLDARRHGAALAAMLALPGLFMLHDGQIDGATVRVPVQLARRPREGRNEALGKIYREILAAFARHGVGRGAATFLNSASGGGAASGDLVAVLWRAGHGAGVLVAVNWSEQSWCGRLALPGSRGDGAGVGVDLGAFEWCLLPV